MLLAILIGENHDYVEEHFFETSISLFEYKIQSKQQGTFIVINHY